MQNKSYLDNKDKIRSIQLTTSLFDKIFEFKQRFNITNPQKFVN